MAARGKIFATALLVLSCVMPSGVKAENAKSQDICMVMAHYNAQKSVQALLNFSIELFGKHPERWAQADIDNLLANAKACDNKPEYLTIQTRVSFTSWRLGLNDQAIRKFLSIANRSIQVGETFRKDWPAGLHMPYCAELIEWKRDPDWFTNNSDVIFKTSFVDLPQEYEPILKGYVEACKPVAEEIVRKRGLPRNRVSQVFADIETSLTRDLSAQRWKGIELVPALRLEHEGKPIPLAYVTASTRDIVLKLNTSETNKIALDINTLASISSWATDMKKRDVVGPDALYVEKIREIVARQLFEQETRYDRP